MIKTLILRLQCRCVGFILAYLAWQPEHLFSPSLVTLSSVIVILNKIRTKQPTSSISIKLENMTFVWQLSSGSFMFSQTLQKCVYKAIVNRLKFLLALFYFFIFIKLQFSLMICVNCNG